MKKFMVATVVALGLLVGSVGTASAAPVFVGSWTTDQGPRWETVPLAYSGLEAAALLFGGLATDYFISTVDMNPNNIDHLAWYSTWGGACGGTFPCGTRINEAARNSVLYALPGNISAYVSDWAIGPQYRNFAFRRDADNVVPEPATLTLLGFGLAGLARLRRRKTE